MRSAPLRLVALLLALAVGAFLLLAGFLGGLHQDDPDGRRATLALASGALLGAALLAARQARWASIALIAVVAAGIATDLLTGSGLASTWWLWSLAAIAGGLAWSAREA